MPERASEFLSSNTVVGDVSTCQSFMDNYSKISGRKFTFTNRDRVRLIMYFIYIIIMMGVEDYRKTEEQAKEEAKEEAQLKYLDQNT